MLLVVEISSRSGKILEILSVFRKMQYALFTVLLLVAVSWISGFTFNAAPRKMIMRQARTTSLQMNFFSNLFGPKQTATARHILMDQVDIEKLEGLKSKIESSSDVTMAFGQAASKFSKCPSSKKAGSLGEFGKGAMVPAFDRVVFDPKTELGTVQGPVATPFGVHLILVEERNSE